LNGIEFRDAFEHERVHFYRAMHRGFSGHFRADEGQLEHDKAAYGPMASAVCAFDGDEVVGTSSWVRFELTVPGGRTDFMGVTDVTVAATHTRRGIMREMMRRLLVKGRDAGQHLAGLWASESNIYGRFGYGVSGGGNIAKIDTRDSRFRAMPAIDGEVRFAEPSKMRDVAPDVWRKAAAVTPGMMLRFDAQWDWIYDDRRINRMSNRKPFYVTYAENDDPQGYAEYHIEHRDDGLHSTNLVKVDELIAVTPAAEVALWRFLLDIDLATEVMHRHHPQKSRLLWLLADPRKLSLTPYDSVWIRILDPIRALTARTYSASGEVVFRIIDDFCPWVQGTYLLSIGEQGSAVCERTGRSPDVTMPIATLGSIYMGAMLLSDLARADRVAEHKSGTTAKIDTMFPTSGVHSFLPDF
jgi:predicted acetyltransferase